MLITTKRRYIKKHVIGGAGIFDTVANFFKRIAGSTVAKTVASKLTSAAQTDLGKKFIEAGKTVGKEVGMKAINVGKDVALAKAKALLDRAAPKVASLQNQEVIRQLTGVSTGITQKSKDTLADLMNMEATTNINKLLAGSGVRRSSAISIQDLVKRLNTGAGLKLA